MKSRSRKILTVTEIFTEKWKTKKVEFTQLLGYGQTLVRTPFLQK